MQLLVASLYIKCSSNTNVLFSPTCSPCKHAQLVEEGERYDQLLERQELRLAIGRNCPTQIEQVSLQLPVSSLFHLWIANIPVNYLHNDIQ